MEYNSIQSLFAELVFFLLRKYLCSRKLPFLTGLLQNDVSESAISPQRLAVGGYACLHESAGNRPSSTPTTDVLLNKFHPDPTAGNAGIAPIKSSPKVSRATDSFTRLIRTFIITAM
jgi:hypothetical protein